MPAKKVITKENILSAALEIVRKEGMDGLNMRTLAKACNCSTQPLYLSFSGMDELKAEVTKKIYETYVNYILNEVASGKYPDYKATGMGYIRFAKEEPQFFRIMFMRNRNGYATVEEKDVFNDYVYQVMRNMGLYQGDLVELHTHMWIWVHGVATMYATGYLEWDWDRVDRMLTDEFFGVKSQLESK